jgi:chromosome segregation ATPase
MNRLPPTLIALALAVAFAAPVDAQQISTSKGVRTLMRTEGSKDESQLRQAALSAENVAIDVMADIAVSERARGGIATTGTSVADRAKKANAELTAAKAAFDAMEQGYRSSLAAFEQRQTAFAADVENQRQQAAVLEALPSAQRDYAEVTRLNTWATELGNTRTQLEQQRAALLSDHDRIETERAKLAKQRADAEAALTKDRDSAMGQYGQAQGKLVEDYRNLRVVTNYISRVREQQRVLTGSVPPRSEVLEQANAKLRAFDARK